MKFKMSCTACNKNYRLFFKERGCPICRFSYCTKCLKKVITEKGGKTKKKVCLKCFEKWESCPVKQSFDDIIPTLEILKIQNVPAKITSSPNNLIFQKINDNNEFSEDSDDIIERKLQKLKENSDTKLQSELEIENRLAALKDIRIDNSPSKDILLNTDNRTDIEKVDDILKELIEEKAINNLDNTSDIERRLAALKVDSRKDVKLSSKSEVKNDQILDIVEDVFNDVFGIKPDNTQCYYCGKDAELSCLACSNNLYCKSCFLDNHKSEKSTARHIFFLNYIKR